MRSQIFGLPIKQVVEPLTPLPEESKEEAFTGEGKAINSGSLLDGKPTVEAKKAIVDELAKKGKGGGVTNYRLRDWVFSR